ncbi:MAG: hypothetical protein GX259_09330 [Bacteroidales bacterium]|nr:hypothetical protein [Bacteroidales bacterium]
MKKSFLIVVAVSLFLIVMAGCRSQKICPAYTKGSTEVIIPSENNNS